MAPKKKPSFVRTTISIPHELRRRMKACGDGVNWSAIAAEAFSVEVTRINTQKEDTKMEDVIERLRTSLRQSESELFTNGREAGEDWAKRYALAVELKRLETAVASGGADWLLRNPRGYAPEQVLAEAARPTEFADDYRAAIAEFWEEALGENYESQIGDAEFVHGFLTGALSIWSDVKDKL